jgi:hypothetical protein
MEYSLFFCKMNSDILHNIMLHASILDVYSFCKTSWMAKKLCNDYFWKQKNEYDHIKDKHIITLDYVTNLAKDVIDLPDINRICIEFHESVNYQELRQWLGIKKIYTGDTYDEINITIKDNYIVNYDMTSIDTFQNVYHLQKDYSKLQLLELLIHLFYYIKDYRFRANPLNYDILTHIQYVLLVDEINDIYVNTIYFGQIPEIYKML